MTNMNFNKILSWVYVYAVCFKDPPGAGYKWS